jgi:hypothetical protein
MSDGGDHHLRHLDERNDPHHIVFEFSLVYYVCPEPVLVKCSFYIDYK